MNRFEKQELAKRLPIVAHLIGDRDVNDFDSIKAMAVDEELLSHTPRYSGATGSLVGIDSTEEIHFVLNRESDPFLIDAVKREIDIIHNEAHSQNEYRSGETIAEAIDRLQIADTVTAIVKERYGYIIRDHYSVGAHSITICLPRKDTSISTYLDSQHTVATAEIDRQLQELQT